MLFENLTAVRDPEPHGAALNMALDEVLLRGAREPLLRVYRWARPSVSFGYFGKIADVELAWAGREIVRRWTGGGIVPHGDDLTYTLIVPRGNAFCGFTARESYRLVHEHIAALLRVTGCEVSVAPSARAKISDACFENPAESDVLTATGKVAGAAQRRTRWGLLHQGSIQLGNAPILTAADLLQSLAATSVTRDVEEDELAAAQELVATRYGTEAWLRRY